MLSWALLCFPGLYWAALSFTGLYWAFLGCTGLQWAQQVVHVDHVDQVNQVIQVVQVISLDDMHSDNIWFSWSKLSRKVEMSREERTDGGGRKVENRAVFW